MRKKYKISLVLLGLLVLLSPLGQVQAFSDINGHWAQDNIGWSRHVGLIKGYQDGTFRPQGNITRAEYYTMVSRLGGLSQAARPNFSDVKEGSWYYQDLSKVLGAGLIENSNRSLDPNQAISRDEASRILARLYKLQGQSQSASNFTDAGQIKSKVEVSSLVDQDIIKGYPDGSFKPNGALTRAEVAKILNTSFSKLGSGNPDLTAKAKTYVPGQTKANQAPKAQPTLPDKSKVYPNSQAGWLEAIQAAKAHMVASDGAPGQVIIGGRVDIQQFAELAHQEFQKNDYDYFVYYHTLQANSNYSNDRSVININYTFYPHKNYPRVKEFIRTWTASNISAADSQEARVKKIHDFIVKKNDYNKGSNFLQYDSVAGGYSVYTPESILFGQGGVCEAYAKLFDLMAKDAGLEVAYVYGRTIPENILHVWNKVKVDGVWYNIDTTHDDPIITDKTFFDSALIYNYYLKSDANFAKTRTFISPEKHPKADVDYPQSHLSQRQWKQGIAVVKVNKGSYDKGQIRNTIRSNFSKGINIVALEGDFTSQQIQDIYSYLNTNLGHRFYINYQENGPIIIRKF